MARPDRNREVWEGWTVGALADDLYALARMINDGNAIKKGFKDKKDLVDWVAYEKPNIRDKKAIKEVAECLITDVGINFKDKGMER